MAAPATRAVRSDGIRSREAILRTAASLASIRGIEALSLGDLAAEVGMSKSGMYAHFGSKEELQLATVEAATAIFEEVVRAPARAYPEGRDGLIALSDLLPEVQFHRHDRVPLALALVLGVLLMGGIALLEGHDHGGHEHGGEPRAAEHHHDEGHGAGDYHHDEHHELPTGRGRAGGPGQREQRSAQVGRRHGKGGHGVSLTGHTRQTSPTREWRHLRTVARRTGSPQVGLVVTTYAVTFGVRQQLI